MKGNHDDAWTVYASGGEEAIRETVRLAREEAHEFFATREWAVFVDRSETKCLDWLRADGKRIGEDHA